MILTTTCAALAAAEVTDEQAPRALSALQRVR